MSTVDALYAMSTMNDLLVAKSDKGKTDVSRRQEHACPAVPENRQAAMPRDLYSDTLRQTEAVLELLCTAGREITSHLNDQEIFQSMHRHLHRMLDTAGFMIYLLDAERDALTLAYGGEAGHVQPAACMGLSDPDSPATRCVRERREVAVDRAVDHYEEGQASLHARTALSLLFSPLMIGERVLAVAITQSTQPHAYGQPQRLIFRSLCAYAAIALDKAATHRGLNATIAMLHRARDANRELEVACATLKDVSLTDPLTGLRNRRFLQEHLDGDIGVCLRRYDNWLMHPTQPKPVDADLIFFMVDIDRFKEINDTYGHAAGDMVLVQMQERLHEVSRDADYVIRWGGEEFLIVARATNRENAQLIADRIRSAVASRDFELGDGVCVTKTCSVGFACFPYLPSHPRLLAWPEVVELADHALFIAKHRGRNAWVGLQGTELTRPESALHGALQRTEQAMQDGEVLLVSSLNPATP